MILDVAHNDPFFVQIGSQKTIFKRFYQLFFRTNGLQHKLLKLIESPNIFHFRNQPKKSKVGVVFWRKIWAKFKSNVVKKQRNWHYQWMGFVQVLHEELHLKAKSSGYRNTSVDIEGQNSKKYHAHLKKIRTKFVPTILG